MKYILGAVIAILCSFTCTDTLYGKSLATDVDDILIINTYTEANPWSNDFITSIVNMASQNSHIGVYTAHMKMLTLDEENKLETFKRACSRVTRTLNLSCLSDAEVSSCAMN